MPPPAALVSLRGFLVLALCLFLAAAPALAEPLASTGLHPDGSSAAAPASPRGSLGAPRVEVVATGLNAATNLAFGPDGTLYFGEWKTGAVYPIGPDGRPERFGNPVLDVGDPAWGNERGFVGLAINAKGEFFTFHTENRSGGGFVNKLTRWTPEGKLDRVLFGDLDAGDWHNAGRIWVDPRDDTVWWAFGDVNKYEVAQDPSDLRGKILHMDRDGKPVPGNLAPASLVFSLGHRQPFGFGVDPASGAVMVAENMDKKNDEVSVVEPGGNYGWPTCEGPCDPPRDGLVDPVIYYPRTIGPTTGTFFAGDFWFGDFNHGALHRVYRESDGAWRDEIAYQAERPPILDLKPGPEGNTLYYSAWSEIVRLTFDSLPAKEPPTPSTPGPGGSTPPSATGPSVRPPTSVGDPPEESDGFSIPGAAAATVAVALGAATLALAGPRKGGR